MPNFLSDLRKYSLCCVFIVLTNIDTQELVVTSDPPISRDLWYPFTLLGSITISLVLLMFRVRLFFSHQVCHLAFVSSFPVIKPMTVVSSAHFYDVIHMGSNTVMGRVWRASGWGHKPRRYLCSWWECGRYTWQTVWGLPVALVVDRPRLWSLEVSLEGMIALKAEPQYNQSNAFWHSFYFCFSWERIFLYSLKYNSGLKQLKQHHQWTRIASTCFSVITLSGTKYV